MKLKSKLAVLLVLIALVTMSLGAVPIARADDAPTVTARGAYGPYWHPYEAESNQGWDYLIWWTVSSDHAGHQYRIRMYSTWGSYYFCYVDSVDSAGLHTYECTDTDLGGGGNYPDILGAQTQYLIQWQHSSGTWGQVAYTSAFFIPEYFASDLTAESTRYTWDYEADRITLYFDIDLVNAPDNVTRIKFNGFFDSNTLATIDLGEDTEDAFGGQAYYDSVFWGNWPLGNYHVTIDATYARDEFDYCYIRAFETDGAATWSLAPHFPDISFYCPPVPDP